MRSATRRASSKSSCEQQVPRRRAIGVEAGFRRQAHRDADDVVALLRSIAAATELSTPPDIATITRALIAVRPLRWFGGRDPSPDRGMIAATASISSAVVFQPRLIRSELRASATVRPIARSTCDGSTAPAAHAEPIDTSIPSRSSAISMLSPSTPGNVRLSVFGSRPTQRAVQAKTAESIRAAAQ